MTEREQEWEKVREAVLGMARKFQCSDDPATRRKAILCYEIELMMPRKEN